MIDYEKELIVAEAYDDDFGRGIARLSPDALSELDASPGDICLIVGDWKCPVVVYRADREDWNSGKVFLDEFTRVNTQAEVGADVTIKAVATGVGESIPYAEKIVLNWYSGLEFDFGPNAVEMIKRQWVKRPVSTGNVLPVMLDVDEGDYIPLVIADVEPDGLSVIGDPTDIRINTA